MAWQHVGMKKSCKGHEKHVIEIKWRVIYCEIFIYSNEKSSAYVKLINSAISNTIHILGMQMYGSVLKQKQFKALNFFSVHCGIAGWESEGLSKNINPFI